MALVLCTAVNGLAQAALPADGLAAEAAGEWSTALAIYKATLEKESHDVALWVRVADIEARVGHLDGTVQALRRAVAEAPRDAALHQRLSQTYAVLNRPTDALDAIERAFELSPGSVGLLRARATLATWSGDHGRARESYQRLEKLLPDDRDVLLSLARVSAWAGRTDAAVDAYTRYLRVEPGAAAVWIELARTESWRGNYSAALRNLETYRARFGSDEAYVRETVAVMARAGRPAEALATLEPLLRQHPNDYELNLTRTVALTMQRRTREASAALETVRRLQPDAAETRSAEALFRTTLAPAVEPGVSVYGDSSTLQVQRAAPRATLSFATGTTVSAGSEHETLSAHQGSGLEGVDGAESAAHDHGWAGASQQLGAVAVIRGRIGRAQASGRELTAYAIGADLSPADGLKLFVERNAGFFVVSPRTIGLGLRQVSHRVRLEWAPDARWQVAADVWHQTLTDGNDRWEITVSPRRSVARTERVNLDLGLTATRLRTATNYDNGYYDPRRYEYYAFTAYPYWKVGGDTGVGLSLALGLQRDDFSPGFRPGGNATADLSLGIYRAWALKLTAGGTFNQRLGTGAFRGYGAAVSLIRRF
jgi:tetratricopeptide (TPR) repeat protein